MMTSRATAPALRQFVEQTMEPMRAARLKQFRKTVKPVMGWKVTSSAGKRGHLETITQISLPVGTTVFVGDTDGYANESFMYRIWRANQATVVGNRLARRPSHEELRAIRKAGSEIDLTAFNAEPDDFTCTLSTYDPEFEYRIGELVVPRGRDFSFEEGYYGPGIHFFVDLYDAYTFT